MALFRNYRTKRIFLVLVALFVSSHAFVQYASLLNPPTFAAIHHHPSTVHHSLRRRRDTWRLLERSNNNKSPWEQELENRSRERAAQNAALGGTAAGAVLGGLLLGPFGALFGANIGANLGAKNALDRARQQEMERMGISQDMLEAARDIGQTLEQTMYGIKACQDSLTTQQRLARQLDLDAQSLYDRATVAIRDKNEEKARTLLLERHTVNEKLKQVLKQCAEERKRLETMQDNVAVLKRRALEIESLLQRSIGVKAMQESQELGFSLSNEDPLLQKFKDLGLD